MIELTKELQLDLKNVRYRIDEHDELQEIRTANNSETNKEM